MSSQSIQTNVPQLRFPNYQDDWRYIRFEHIGNIIRGASPRPKGDPRYYGHGVPRLMVEDVARDGKYVDPITDSLTHEGARLSRLCPKNTLTIVCSGTAKTVGQASFLKTEACIHDGFLAILDIKKDYSDEFVYYQIQKFQEKSERMATHGGTFINLTTGILKNFSRYFPEYLEQQKIVSFLSAVDYKIAGLQKKKDLLEAYKKGMMQRLFSQNLRFKDNNGKPFPDWSEKPIEDIFIASKGHGLSKDKISEAGQYPCVLYGELYTTYDETIKNVKSKTDANEGLESQKGDLLVPSSTTTTGVDLANVTALPHGGVKLGGDITVMRFKEPTHSSLFYAYYLSNYKKYDIARFAQGITIVHLYFNHFKKMLIDVPHPDEQKKISDFLSAIDDKIDLVAKELECAQTFKKGLLQQMFV